ncbi:hypothetical protein TELCIR_06686 [Teladorsagia circumcincta]|uniref:Uncharacterized protein n=1 Tax=Teladorsagia circumcincta TaxID=45464 RepID=A0A2G9UPP5_TELCI|nr:hypothetical protein TELCIR_06686 [Teladorsagia circumcincta]
MFIDIPTCSSYSKSKTAVIKWKCPMDTARSILQLAHCDRKNFNDQIRKYYGVPVDEAKRAGSISEKQMRIAAELDDQTLLSRCHLYIALSEAQQANFTRARKIVRPNFYPRRSILRRHLNSVILLGKRTILSAKQRSDRDYGEGSLIH